MKNEIIEGFVEGFKGGIRLGYDLVRNLLMAVPLTLYEFVNRDIPSKKSASGKPKEGGHPGRARADR